MGSRLEGGVWRVMTVATPSKQQPLGLAVDA